MKKYRGVFPAIYTCYDSRGHIDPRGVRNIARFLCEKGVGGIYVNGKPDQGPPLTVREKMAVLENVMVQAEGRVMVICQVGCESPEETAELARFAALCGADAAAVPRPCLCPDTPALLDAWRRVAESAGDADMIFCGCPVPADEEEKNRMSEFARETRMKGIIAPEERTETIAEYKKVCGDKMSLFSLREGCFEDAIGWGADAVISYLSTLIPETCVRRESDIRYHSHRRPAEEKGVLARLDSLMLAASSRPAVAREVLRNAWGVDCGSVRPPWTEMTEEDRKIAAECVGVIRGM